MPDIRHRVEIAAPLDSVYQAVATPEGVSSWWTVGGVTGESKLGANLEIRFGNPEPSAVMEITRLDPEGHVGWLCVDGAPEWVGTTISFDLSRSGDKTVVLFAHAGWPEALEFMSHCSTRWGYFLISLKLLMETGQGTPFPEDLKF